jgi:putative membrane protein
MNNTIRSIALHAAVALVVGGCAHQESPANGPGDLPLVPIGDAGDAAAVTAMPPQGPRAPTPAAEPTTTLTVSNGRPLADNDTANDVPTNAAMDLSDAQILEVTRVASRGEIEQDELAQSKGRDAQVKKLAAMMIKEHAEADSNGIALAKAVGLTPASSATSMTLEADTRSATSALKTEAGADFDRRYVDAQVKEHRAVLEALEDKLLPNARNADLKAYLMDLQAKVATQLQRSQALQGELDVKARAASAVSGM